MHNIALSNSPILKPCSSSSKQKKANSSNIAQRFTDSMGNLNSGYNFKHQNVASNTNLTPV